MTIRSAITAPDCRSYLQALKAKKLAPATIAHAFLPLRQILNLAIEDRAIDHNATFGIRLPSNASTQRPVVTHFLTSEEVGALAAAMPTTTDALLVTFACYSGLRAGELAGLNVSDYDPLRSRACERTRTKVRDGLLVGTPKTERWRRTVPTPSWLVTDLNDYLATIHPAPTANAPLFPGRHRYPDLKTKGLLDWSEPWERDAWVKRTFKPALAKAKLDGAVRFHDLRHTYASLMFAGGSPRTEPRPASWRRGPATLRALPARLPCWPTTVRDTHFRHDGALVHPGLR